MPRTSITTTFSASEFREMLSRETGIPVEEIKVSFIDQDGHVRGLNLWQLQIEQEIHQGSSTAPETPQDDAVVEKVKCRACGQNLVREVSAGSVDGVPKMAPAPDGLCHFCKNPS